VTEPAPPNAPIQFVVVQQRSKDGEDESLEDILKKVVGADQGQKETGGKEVKIKLRSSLAHLSIASFLAIVIVLQAIGLFKPREKVGSDTGPTIEINTKSLSQAFDEINKSLGQSTAQQAQIDDLKNSARQQDSALHRIENRLDTISANLSDIPSRQTEGTKFVPVPYPFMPAAISTSGSAPLSSPESPRFPNLVVNPSFYSNEKGSNTSTASTQEYEAQSQGDQVTDASKACEDGEDGKSAILMPDATKSQMTVKVCIKYTNAGADDLSILDSREILSADDSTQCNMPQAGSFPLFVPPNKPEGSGPFTVGLNPGFSRASHSAAKSAWDKGSLYLTLCTTYRSDAQSTEFLSRLVFHITKSGHNWTIDQQPLHDPQISIR